MARAVPVRARLATSLVVLIALMWTSFLGSVVPLARAASANPECCCCEPRSDEAGDAHERLERERASMDCCEASPPAPPASPAIIERAPHDEDALAAMVPVADALAGLRRSRVELGACGARGPPPARREPLFIWHCSVLL